MKIPFTLDAWLKDKSQKVETRDGRLVHNIWQIKESFYRNNRKAEVCALIDGEEDALVFFEGGRYLPTAKNTDSPFDLFLVISESELSEFEERIFKLLRQYKECDIPLTPENIKSEASTLWPDFEKYFFDLYGKEGEGDSALRSFYYKGLADGKAEALKDLPRWKKLDFVVSETFLAYRNEIELFHKGRVIALSELEKLPGFKEDSHE